MESGDLLDLCGNEMTDIDCDNSQNDSTVEKLADCDNSQENVLHGDVDIQINNSTKANFVVVGLHCCPLMQIAAVASFQYRIFCFVLYSYIRSI